MAKKDFWDDLDESISNIIRDALLGRNIPKLAMRLDKTDDLLYKWSNPNAPQLPSLKQFLQLLRIIEDCAPLKTLVEACGFAMIPLNGNLLETLKALVQVLEKEAP